MKTEVQNILSTLKRTFEKNAWHGPAVKEVLVGITPDLAHQKLTNTHSIIELVAHMTSWRIFVMKRISGDNEFEITDELNFPKVTDWHNVVQDLEESQQNLLAALADFPDSWLSEIVPHGSYQYSYYTLLHGIIHHDLYHTGQIILIRKSLEQQSV